jgi:glycine cleavage system H protein
VHYTAEHEWIRSTERPGVVRIGITDFAQEQLGDVVYVDLPAVGTSVTAGQSCGEIESTKSVSELFAPVDGVVVARNETLETAPDEVNAEPYGAGWLLEIETADPTAVDSLLSADDYRALTEG